MSRKTKPITISLTPHMITLLEQLWEQKQISRSAIIALALEEYARREIRYETREEYHAEIGRRLSAVKTGTTTMIVKTMEELEAMENE